MPRDFMQTASAVLLLLAAKPVWPAVLTNDDQGSLQKALNAGGLVSFSNFNGVITLTNTLSIKTNVTLNGGSWKVQLSGGGTTTTTTNTAGSTNGATSVLSVPSTNGFRIFDIATNGNLTLLNIVLVNGRGNPGGAILNNGTLVLSNCALVSNGAVGAPGTNGNTSGQGGASTAQPGSAGIPGWGGAICNFGSCTALHSIFINNAAVGGNGGNGGHGLTGGPGGNGASGGSGGAGAGGALYSTRTLSVIDCIFAQNLVLGGNGGAGGNYGGGYSSVLSGGSGTPGGTSAGGAIHNDSMLVVSGSTFMFNNTAAGDSRSSGISSGYMHGPNGPLGAPGRGGAICNAGTLAMWNSTFFHNKVSGGRGGNGATNVSNGFGGDGGWGGTGWGGAVLNTNSASSLVTNCTFVENSSLGGYFGLGGPGPNGSGVNGTAGFGNGGSIANSGGIFTLRDSLLANARGGTNVTTNVFFTTSSNRAGQTNAVEVLTNSVSITNLSSGPNGYGSFADADYNFSNDGTPLLAGTNLTNGTPRLGSLWFNGGPTPTVGLLTGSPAMNRGDPAVTLPTDQRGWPRPLRGRADIGALEAGLTISGSVLEGTNGLGGIGVTGGRAPVSTDNTGNYQVENLAPGSYTIAPRQDGVGFQPLFAKLVLTDNDVSNVVFTAHPVLSLEQVDSTNAPSWLLTITGLPSRLYEIDAATNLTPPVFWMKLATNAANDYGVLPMPLTNDGNRFYRVIVR